MITNIYWLVSSSNKFDKYLKSDVTGVDKSTFFSKFVCKLHHEP